MDILKKIFKKDDKKLLKFKSNTENSKRIKEIMEKGRDEYNKED